MFDNKKTAIIALGNRNPGLSEEIESLYKDKGYSVVTSNCDTRKDIIEMLEKMNNDGTTVDTLVYMSPLPFKASVLDDDFSDKVFERLNDDLETGMWWIKEVAGYMASHGGNGSIVLIGHITSIVPTHGYSYCSTSQAALLNLAKVGAIDAQHAGYNIRLNTVVAGWSEENIEEREYVELLKKVHASDSSPILSTVTHKEVAEACVSISELKAANGATVTVDGGFSITRPIRQIKV